MCRGNYKGMYLSEGGYDSVAEKLFGRANVNHFLLEFDTPRAGSFTPLRFLPKTKGVVLGMVSSKVPAARADRFAQAARRRSRRSTSIPRAARSARSADSRARSAAIR
jgi:methionine synthase II (cobalamin-independent)